MEDNDWLWQEKDLIALCLEEFAKDPASAKGKIRLYVQDSSRRLTVVAFESGLQYYPEDQEPLIKDECTRLSLLHDFETWIRPGTDWSMDAADELIRIVQLH